MKKVAIIGHFAFGKEYFDGQTIKTKTLSKELHKQLGDKEIIEIDTHGGKKKLLKLFFQIVSVLKRSKNVIILPAHNGLRFIAPVLAFWNVFFRRKIHYVVIGGWLPKFLLGKKRLKNKLKKFTRIYVETSTMKTALENQGFSNIVIMPNFKELNVLSESELIYCKEESYKLCTFSRVMKEKGIEDAINVVKKINEEQGREIYSLDIYGQVDSNQVEWFDELQNTFPPYVNYRGIVPFDKSVDVLKDYFALLFPTKFYTEGIPGTIIDAYAAGIPVISAKWQNFTDVIDDGVTGIGYELDDLEEFKKVLEEVILDKNIIEQKKKNCLEKAMVYLPNKAVNVLVEELG